MALNGHAESCFVEATDASAVGHIRRQAAALAGEIGLSADAIGRVAIVATELAGNLWKHAGGQGWCDVAARQRGNRRLVRLVCADGGRGIGDVAAALRDGFSTGSTPGTGLGAVQRLSQGFDLFTAAGDGTVVTAEVGEPSRAGSGESDAVVWDGVARAKPGQQRCGDAWGSAEEGNTLWVALADGLGHGPHAAVASELAVATVLRRGTGAPADRISAAHAALHSTRGAAVALAAVDAAAGVVRFSGIGNVSAVVEDRSGRHSLVSMNGTAGHYARSVREFTSPWNADSVLVLHTDGVTSRWELAGRPGLALRHPATVAALLLRDFARGNDDASVVVVRPAA